MEATSLDIEALKKAVQDEAERMKREEGRHGNDAAQRTEKVLGGMFELSPALASALNIVVNTVQPKVRRFVEDGIRASATPVLARAGVQPEVALKASNMLAHGAGWALTFYDETGGVVGDTRKHFKELGEIKHRFSKANVAHGGKADALGALKGNELVAVEMRRVNTRLRTNLVGEACGLLASAPQAYIKMLDDRERGAGVVSSMLPRESVEDYVGRLTSKIDKEAQQAESIEDSIRKTLAPIRERIHAQDLDPKEKRDALRNIESRVRAQLEEKQSVQVDEATVREMLVPIGAIASVAARDTFMRGRSEDAKSLKTTAMDMIEKLTDVVINDKDARTVSGLSFEAYIRNIFNTHQENMGEPRIGKRFDEQLNYACKEIAKAIGDGKIHPMALVSLVGERKIVKDTGKHIANRDEVAQALAEQINQIPAKFSVDPKEYMAEAAVTEDDLKRALETLKDKDRDFFIALLPEEVAQKVGLKDQEIKVAHGAAKADFAQTLSQAVLDMATLSDEQLKEAKLSREEIAVIRKAAPDAEQGRADAVMERIGKKGNFRNTLDMAVVNAIGGGLEGHLGELYDRADHKLHAEHAHAGGTYEKHADKLAKPGHEHHEHTVEHAGFEGHDAAPALAALKEDSWEMEDSLAELSEKAPTHTHGKHSGSSHHAASHVVRQVHHQGMQQESHQRQI